MEKSGNTLLREWITATGRKVTWLATEVPANRATVHQWLNGRYTPHPVVRARIEAITDGAVPAGSWVSQ